jgi:aerobic-type carbon monoxide dehydrogenase small subunit (CoxS/CutS family)
MPDNTLTVNGKPIDVADADPQMPLLWYLRDVLELTGTKYGCGMGLCGACTVHLDGTAIRTCQTPLSAAFGKQITTIEGLSENGTHPVQQAWLEHDVPQCGYCQAGQIMAAADFLARNPAPTVEEIDQAMQGNICRCGTYLRIREAMQSAAARMNPTAEKTKEA